MTAAVQRSARGPGPASGLKGNPVLEKLPAEEESDVSAAARAEQSC